MSPFSFVEIVIMCKVVNKYKSSYDVYIGRGSPFGNPFVIGTHGDRAEVIRKYKAWFTKQLSDHTFHQQVQQLRGKTLGCFCKPLPCHGDVIVEWLEQNQ